MPRAFRASLFHCLDDPGEGNARAASEFFEDGLLVVGDGLVLQAGPADALLATLPADVPVTDYTGRLILPGLVDCHVHFPQMDIIASDGSRLLEWLERYAYPEEARFADPSHAADTAAAFLDGLLANGTTTALVFATVHPQSVEALFAAALERDMRLVSGKVLMDRNCPEGLADDARVACGESRRLVEQWHGRGRLGYAITPRFAVTSSTEQLHLAGRLAAEYPGLWVHTHLAENEDEVAAVARLHPERKGYLDVYDDAGLLGDRSVFAHCLHLAGAEIDRLAARGGAAAFCPSSNLFLGSGLFDLHAMTTAGVRVGLATDVGAGTSLSMLRTAGEAYKVLQLRDQALGAERALYLATLGAARALSLDAFIGNFAVGKEADFIVVDPAATPLSARRARRAADLPELLFAMLFLADDRHIHATYLRGREAALSR